MKMPAALAPMQAHWRTLAPREQALLLGAAWLVGLALLWWLLVLPPLRTLRQADAQQRMLDTQLQKMQVLQMQAQTLQSQPKLNRDDAVRALEASVKQSLGAGGQLNVVGDRATVTLRNVPADALAQWLTQARINARAIPAEAKLVRTVASSAGGAGPAAPPLIPPPRSGIPGASLLLPGQQAAAAPSGAGAGAIAWDGTLVMSLPAQ
jgi:general secretion pathway protein M